ncbi:MAG: sigma-54 dependent transcriptional regulator, partial [Deltaproteobacteria bacterium]|nr:sigma-54 dependent transcriptional regulator [Deltaproteobacteria bacterium]
RTVLEIFFRKKGYRVDTGGTVEEAYSLISTNVYDIVITDMKIASGDDGIRVLEKVKETHPETEVIVMTAHGSIENAVSAMRKGAFNYVTKPFDNQELNLFVERALEKKNIILHNQALREEVRRKLSYEFIIGSSEPMTKIYELIEKIAPTMANVLILGESGTGKELVARAIHNKSDRGEGNFVEINCAAIPESLLESELFGHVKGAFTGAVSSKQGLFEVANGGTLFLDEIGEMPVSLQGKLLRALQERAFRRVGGNDLKRVDVRIVSASKRNLLDAAQDGSFRDDLFYRLNVVLINVPPLRDRREDIPILSHHFLNKYSIEIGKEVNKISPEAMRMLIRYDFPGNVRELENIIERSVILETKDQITPESLPEDINFAENRDIPDFESANIVIQNGESLDGLVGDMERNFLLKALDMTGGNKTEAAKLLKISFRSLRYRLEKFGIE